MTLVKCEVCGTPRERPLSQIQPRMYCGAKCMGIGRTKTDGINLTLFDAWSSSRAYLIGAMAADGCICSNGYFATFWSCDLEFAQIVQRLLGERAHIGRRYPKRAKLPTYCVSLSSKVMVARLVADGIHPKKSKTITFPYIPKAFFWDFIRGLFDGDGTVEQSGQLSITTGSEKLACSLVAEFKARGLSAGKRSPLSDGNWRIGLDKPSSVSAYTEMYHAGAIEWLERKRETMESRLSKLDTRLRAHRSKAYRGTWTDGDREIMRERYSREAIPEIARHLARTPVAIMLQARRMGLTPCRA